MTPAEIRIRVRCGACRGPLGKRLNLVALDCAATWKYPSAGNVLTGEEGGACAVICDRCVEERRKIVEAVEFAEGWPVYHPVAELAKIKGGKLELEPRRNGQ